MTALLRRELGNKRAEVSYLINHIMKKGGWTQPKLAKALGCSTENVNKTINGHGHSFLVLDGLRDIAKVPESYLFDPRKHKAGGQS